MKLSEKLSKSVKEEKKGLSNVKKKLKNLLKASKKKKIIIKYEEEKLSKKIKKWKIVEKNKSINDYPTITRFKLSRTSNLALDKSLPRDK